jgi:hypothetical protein
MSTAFPEPFPSMHYSTNIILAAVAYVGAEKVYNTAPGKTLARRQQFCGTDGIP